ncbi:MAG: RNA-binding domain-containing protein [Candidatus Woesearchaeota archaeon]
MKFANNIHLRVFCKSDDQEEQIVNGLLFISGFSLSELEDEKVEIKKLKAKGFSENIFIFELLFVKDRHINRVLKHINSNLSSNDKRYLVEQDNRLDDNLDFFIRLSKPLILENSFELTDGGDCFHIKINIAAFPKKKVVAKEKIKEIFS